ncbi:hypothetical protein FLL45_05460 [Aliikangiella marina]|uniref:ParB/Sulfiredoxin domain-containing protein n=1 Tax=Aliikangiella marina TaxID=1712262 RepID=A0A545TJJ4_9GAMM|nr:hypothetical protein [Aliikangiella marina]TQV77392.1 hypothetical protein FLL45_05460 [Aliikangiella marina]
MNGVKYEQLLVSNLNNKDKKIDLESFKYKSIFLSSIVPDEENARFLPAVLIEDEHANLFVTRKITKKQLVDTYLAEDKVIIGKSCIINCLKYGSKEWKKANQTIESIIELGNNIAISELIQAPTVYPLEDGKYKVLTGHRRFFALVYANGYGSAAQFKLYNNKPLLAKVKQFQENASREDLPQYGKLAAFLNAMSEINTLNTARVRVGLKRLTIKETATNLGISMGAFDNYNVLTRYPCILEAYESGLSNSFVKTKKIVLDAENEYKISQDKTTLNITDRKKINQEIELRLSNSQQAPAKTKPFKVRPIKSSSTVKKLLTSNIMELKTGIDWKNIDWDDHLSVSNVLTTVIEYLEDTK